MSLKCDNHQQQHSGSRTTRWGRSAKRKGMQSRTKACIAVPVDIFLSTINVSFRCSFAFGFAAYVGSSKYVLLLNFY